MNEPNRRSRFAMAVDTSLLLACIAVATSVVYGQFIRPRDREEPPPVQYIANWRSILGSGVRLGPPDATVHIIEFGDLQCPFCRTFHDEITQFMEESQHTITLEFVHFPLSQHRFAVPSARALECADRQGRGKQFLDHVLSRQDSLGLNTWESYANATGVPVVSDFIGCIGSDTSIARVELGKALGAKLNVDSTPTVIINGWRFSTTPTGSALVNAINAIVEGTPPVDEYEVVDTELEWEQDAWLGRRQ